MAKPSKKTIPEPIITVPEVPVTATADFFERKWLPEALLILAAVLVYFLSLNNGLVFFDDDKAILYNHALQNPSLGKFFTGQNLGMYAPFTWIAYWMGSLISGQEAYGYHLLALICHAISSVLIFSILKTLSGRSWLAFFCALLFTVHPIQVEAVSWAAALSTVLFAAFYLGSFRAYLSFAQAAEKGTTTLPWIALSLGLFMASVLSKSAAVTLPVLLIAIDFLFYKNLIRKFWTSKILYFLIAFGFGLYTFTTREAEGHDIALSSSVFSLVDRFFMISQTILFYPFKLLAPFGFTVAYPFTKDGGSWAWYYYASPVVLAAIAGLVWKMARNDRDVLWGIALYLIPLAVMLPIRTVGSFELRSDRYAYISCIGIFWLIGLLLEKTNQVLRLAVTFGLAAILGILAFNQTTVWKDGVKLFKNCVGYTPESSLCQCNLAYNELIRSDFQNAATHYTEALKLDPETVEAYNGRGQAYLNLKKIQEAYSDFDNAIKSGLSSPKLFLNRGKCLVMLNRANEAGPDLAKSIELEKNNPEAFYLRGFSYEKAGETEKAIADYGESIRLNPKAVEALVNRGLLYYKAQQYQQAIDDYTAALAINPSLVQALNNRANAEIALGQLDKALADAKKALEINPNYTFAQQTLERVKAGMK